MQPHLRLTTSPLADPANVVTGPGYRITVLDDGLVRLEWDGTDAFEDRASQFAIDRAFPPSEFTVADRGDVLELTTSRLHLRYDRRPFSTEGLSVRARGDFHSERGLWRFGDTPRGLGGTARTLDEVDGPCLLEPGVLSRDGVMVVDDSSTVLLTDDGWIAPRRTGRHDVYVFAYGRDYRAGLRALHRLAGPQPLLPRWALGNWWSRYHPYTAQEYLALVDRFRAAGIPLSVGVLDMDWHLVDIDPRFGSGWTGYTWNRELFPDPPAFLRALHERGLRTSLNVHPADGVRAHEDAYPAMARRLGVDPSTEAPIDFDPTDPAFLEAYLDELHHPLEAEGVDLWWLDWQQGGVTRVPGLDPLWLLNHFHYLDSGRDGRRPLTFSRYAGVGSHRYPVGFSGDTVVSWASLQFQPYFTATASNVGYGWWSHDVGGHMFGAKDDELATRWVQLGCFSPVNRLHSTAGIFNTKEPWRFGERAEQVMTRYLRLRHRLLPYLQTMNVRAHVEGASLVAPMYYDHPEVDEAYDVPNQFLFGTELLVAPITTPADPSTLRASTRAWLPPGPWVDVITGQTYTGDRTLLLHRDLDTIPVLARAGAIVPMSGGDLLDADDPALELHVVAGADGAFTLVEDHDDDGRWARTPFTFGAEGGTLRIGPVTGEASGAPASRHYELVLHGAARVDGATVTAGSAPAVVEPVAGPIDGSVRIVVGEVRAADGASVQLRGDLTLRTDDGRARAFDLLDAAQLDLLLKPRVYEALDGPLPVVLGRLSALGLSPALHGALVELVTANPG